MRRFEEWALRAKAGGRQLCPVCREPLPVRSLATGVCPVCQIVEERLAHRRRSDERLALAARQGDLSANDTAWS